MMKFKNFHTNTIEYVACAAVATYTYTFRCDMFGMV